MVSFWPFRNTDTSAESFEKVLSQLTAKIATAAAQNEGLRQRQRRYKVLWTLYSTFAYILVALILTLVTGYQRWGAIEYSAVAGGPLLIYGIRTTLDAFYNYRIANSQHKLNELYKQRESSIEKLKAATKYNSTQQLLEKYGQQMPKQQDEQQKKRKPDNRDGQPQRQPQPPVQRTGFAPPPTANIARAAPTSQSPPQPPHDPAMPPVIPSQPVPRPQLNAGDIPSSADFAPNAFPAPPPQPSSTQYAAEGPKWYDRIMDVVLGEDETQAKNRIALICHECRLVNGQAPPGARTLEEVGRWRCSSCKAWNGVESEEKKILKQISAYPQPSNESPPTDGRAPQPVSSDEDFEEIHDVDEQPDEVEISTDTPAGSTRSKARQRKKD